MSFPAEKENLVDGPEASGRLVLASLSLSLILLFPLLAVSPLRYSWGLLALALAAGAYLLILPAARLYWTRERPQSHSVVQQGQLLSLDPAADNPGRPAGLRNQCFFEGWCRRIYQRGKFKVETSAKIAF